MSVSTVLLADGVAVSGATVALVRPPTRVTADPVTGYASTGSLNVAVTVSGPGARVVPLAIDTAVTVGETLSNENVDVNGVRPPPRRLASGPPTATVCVPCAETAATVNTAVAAPYAVTAVAGTPSTVNSDAANDRASNAAANVTVTVVGAVRTSVPAAGVTAATASGGADVTAPATLST